MAGGNMAGETLLADRYGRRSPPASRNPVLLGLAGFVLLALVWAGWVAYGQATAAVRWQDGRFTALDDGRAQLTFQVTTDPGRVVVCTIRVLNPGLTEVGRLDWTAGPSTQRTFTVTATVPTFELGSSGSVRDCAVR